MTDSDVINDVDSQEVDPVEDDLQEQDPQEDRRRGFWAVLLMIVLALAVAIWIWVNTAVVPDVVGMPEKIARARVEAAGFDVGEIYATDDFEVAEGEIDDQGPAGGRRVLKGTDVTLVIAQGTGRLPEPDVDEGNGLGAGGYDFSDKKTSNVEDYYDPGTGYTQPKNYEDRVPQALNETESRGRAILANAGYRIEVHYGLNAGGIADGRIFYQNPPPGAYEQEGTTVVIWVSTGSPPNPEGGLYTQPGKP